LLKRLPGGIGLSCVDQRVDIAQPVLLLSRLSFQRSPQVPNRGSELVSLSEQYAQIVIRFGVIWLRLQNSAVERFSLLQAARLVVSDGLLQSFLDGKSGHDQVVVVRLIPISQELSHLRETVTKSKTTTATGDYPRRHSPE
jgi:hypothetical protein